MFTVQFIQVVCVWCCSRSLSSCIDKCRQLQMVMLSCHRWRNVHWMRVSYWSGMFSDQWSGMFIGQVCSFHWMRQHTRYVKLLFSCVTFLHWNTTQYCTTRLNGASYVLIFWKWYWLAVVEVWFMYIVAKSIMFYARVFVSFVIILCVEYMVCEYHCCVFIAAITWTTLRNKKFLSKKFFFRWEIFGCRMSVKSKWLLMMHDSVDIHHVVIITCCVICWCMDVVQCTLAVLSVV